MTLTLADSAPPPEPLEGKGGWPLPREPLFMGSDQFNTLSRELSRFVNGDVLGRSYLIAGHRGAGKTALVIRAVQDLRTSLLRESVKLIPILPHQTDRLERPLIVKLHGPSLLCPPTAPPNPPAPPASAAAQARAGDGKPAAPASPANPAPSGHVEPGAHAALVQITIGLYRALAAEAALGFGVHARRARESEISELAAQLALELDGGPEPALLRDYWKALDRFSKGVFWPHGADRALEARDLHHDQGMREIVALATAAQAFRVCTGRMTYDKTVKDSDVLTAETTAKAATDFKDVIGRVSTLGVGALTGVSLLGATGAGPIGAVAGGLAVWLIGNFSLNWSITRKRTKDQQVTYNFIRDFEITTLDRDLPLVIERIRGAGLAPVFVVDELDKVDDAFRATDELIKRLKHLTTDYGFFCFLVNRDLYEQIDQVIEKLAYPVQHTYFSQRLLVRPDAGRLLVYLAKIVKADPPTTDDDLARTVFALSVMHRGKFNQAELTRAIADLAGPVDALSMTNTELTSRKQLFVAAVQVAINEALRNAATADRMRDDSSYAQLAIDTLYYPSRCWELGDTEVQATLAELKKYLKTRIASGATAEGAAEPELTDTEVKTFQALLIGLLKDLSNFPALVTKLGDRGVFDDALPAIPELERAGLPTKVKLIDVFPSIEAGASLMTAPRGSGLTYTFAYDRQGEKVKPAADQWSDADVTRARKLIAIADAFDRMLERAGVDMPELTAAGLLPAMPSAADFATARADVQAAIDSDPPGPTPGAASGLDRLRRLANALDKQGDALGPALLLVASVKRDAGLARGALGGISRLIDFKAPPATWVQGWTVPSHPIVGDATAMKTWLDAIEGRLLPPADLTEARSRDRYDILSERLPRHLDSGGGPLGPFRYWELVLAAAGDTPYRHLANHPETMLARDWSGLALAAMPTQSEPAQAPFWLLIAALRGLGFGQALLTELADPAFMNDLIGQRWRLSTPSMNEAQSMELARRLATTAPPASPGVLLIAADADALAGAQLPSRRRPTLVIGEQDDSDYIVPISWLDALGAFAALAEEDLPEEPRKPQ